jgi:hypothetical protein
VLIHVYYELSKFRCGWETSNQSEASPKNTAMRRTAVTFRRDPRRLFGQPLAWHILSARSDEKHVSG